jgi:hypothetical protein
MITKISACKIEDQPNVGIFVWYYDNPIKRKLKKNRNSNSKLIKYKKMKLNKIKKNLTSNDEIKK